MSSSAPRRRGSASAAATSSTSSSSGGKRRRRPSEAPKPAQDPLPAFLSDDDEDDDNDDDDGGGQGSSKPAPKKRNVNADAGAAGPGTPLRIRSQSASSPASFSARLLAAGQARESPIDNPRHRRLVAKELTLRQKLAARHAPGTSMGSMKLAAALAQRNIPKYSKAALVVREALRRKRRDDKQRLIPTIAAANAATTTTNTINTTTTTTTSSTTTTTTTTSTSTTATTRDTAGLSRHLRVDDMPQTIVAAVVAQRRKQKATGDSVVVTGGGESDSESEWNAPIVADRVEDNLWFGSASEASADEEDMCVADDTDALDAPGEALTSAQFNKARRARLLQLRALYGSQLRRLALSYAQTFVSQKRVRMRPSRLLRLDAKWMLQRKYRRLSADEFIMRQRLRQEIEQAEQLERGVAADELVIAGRCTHRDADGCFCCSSRALPMSPLCLRHILHDPRQVLYVACEHVSPSGLRCPHAVLKSRDPLLCAQHARLLDLDPHTRDHARFSDDDDSDDAAGLAASSAALSLRTGISSFAVTGRNEHNNDNDCATTGAAIGPAASKSTTAAVSAPIASKGLPDADAVAFLEQVEFGFAHSPAAFVDDDDDNDDDDDGDANNKDTESP